MANTRIPGPTRVDPNTGHLVYRLDDDPQRMRSLGYGPDTYRQGFVVNAINRFCDWLWPSPPPGRWVNRYRVYPDPYAWGGSDAPHEKADTFEQAAAIRARLRDAGHIEAAIVPGWSYPVDASGRPEPCPASIRASLMARALRKENACGLRVDDDDEGLRNLRLSLGLPERP